MEINKTFLAGKMNKDLDERLLSGGQYSDALNITIDTSEGSNVGSISNSLGNTLTGNISTILDSYTPVIGSTNAKTIGAIEYEPLNLIYWFVSADEYDAIFEYNEIDNTTKQVIISTKTGGNPSQLNLSQEYLITGVNYIPGHKDSGALLFWTDNLNPPRKINIARSKEYAVNDARIDIDIDVILRPPLKAPVIYPITTDVVQSSSMEERFLYFSYRYKYVDNEYSSMSPFSSVAFKPGEYEIDYLNGNNKAMVNTYNQCRIVFETGNEYVDEIQILAYDTRSLNVKIVKSINKNESPVISSNNVSDYTFDNNKIYAPLPSDQVTRLFDNVPLQAKAQEIIGNRLIYGNYTQFRDIVNSDGNDIDMNFSVTYTSKDGVLNQPISTFRSDRDYEVGIIYGDDYGRMTTALISNSNSTYIPPAQSTKGNSLRVDISNFAPTWATNYRLVVKQSSQSYYNIFPIWFYSDASYRYFRINESDRDKFSVGDYVIFKTDGKGPTYSNKKYKILEFELKSDNFIGNEEKAGLYFKIKVDNVSKFNSSSFPNFGGEDSGYFASVPIADKLFIYLDKTIFYGSGDPSAMVASLMGGSAGITGNRKDRRYTIEIDSVDPTTYRYTDSVDLSYWIAGNIPLLNDTNISVSQWSSDDGAYTEVVNLFTISFPSTLNSVTQTYESPSVSLGDQWKVNIRGNNFYFPYAYPVFTADPYPAAGIYNIPPSMSQLNNIADEGFINISDVGSGGPVYGGMACVNSGYQATSANGLHEVDRVINAGAQIEITITSDNRNINAYTETQEWTSPSRYENIEEWFIESGAYKQFIQHDSDGNDVGSNGISFRRARYAESTNIETCELTSGFGSDGYTSEQPQNKNFPIRMIVPGYGFDSLQIPGNTIEVEYKIVQTDVSLVCETDPKENDVEIYHEVTDSYDIDNGLHKVGWDYADYTHALTVFPWLTYVSDYTILGPLDPANPQPTDKPHNFSIGQQVYNVSSVAISPAIPNQNPDTGQPYYIVLAVPNQYCIVVNKTWVAPGPSEAGIIYHQLWEQNQTTTNQGVSIEINQTTSKNSQFNAFAFGNGVESYRIKDDFNAPEMKFSPRITSIIEDYENERKEASLTYSGVYRGDTSINRLNEFNLSIANFRDLDREFGSIEKLYARDTDVFVLHQDKINKVLYGKNVLYDAIGGGQVASIPEVLGNEIPFPVEYGISNNPESFATNAGSMFFTDSRRGAAIGIENGQVSEISSLGMTDYFRDEFKDNPNTQKIGAYDPYSNRYTISTENTRTVNPCRLSLSRNRYNVRSNSGGLSYLMFSISTSQTWTISLVDTGYGTSWVSPSSVSGYGAIIINANVANNFTSSIRSVNFVVTYCTNQTQTFTLTQAVASPISVDVIVRNKKDQG